MKYVTLSFLAIFSFASQAIAISCNDLLIGDSSIDASPLVIGEINYQVFGDPTKPPLVLIHGLDSAWQTFSNVTEVLSKDFYIVAYDQRGHGLSHEGGNQFNSTLMAQDLLVLMDHLHIKKANILGHSMGARTAVRFAASNPERVISVVVEDMELHARTADLAEKRQRIEAMAKQLRAIPKVYESREALVAALKPMYGDEAESLSFRRAKRNADGTFELLFRPAVSFLYGWKGNIENLLPVYEAIQAPVLVMQANPKMGTALTKQGLNQMKAVKPNATYVYFENAGHTIHRGDQDGFLKVLIEFLNQ